MTLSFKVNRQGHVFVFNIFDILDLENVWIDTKIDFVSCLQPEIWKVMQKSVWPWFSRSNIMVRWLILGFLRSPTLQMLESTPRSSLYLVFSLRYERSYNECVWPWVPRSTVKVTWLFFTYSISSTSKMLESTPRSTSYHVYNRRWERSCKKVFDLDFQGHAIKIEFFHYHRWIPWPRKHTQEKYLKKIRTGRQKSRRGCINPPLGVFGWRNTLGVCGLKHELHDLLLIWQFFQTIDDVAKFGSLFRGFVPEVSKQLLPISRTLGPDRGSARLDLLTRSNFRENFFNGKNMKKDFHIENTFTPQNDSGEVHSKSITSELWSSGTGAHFKRNKLRVRVPEVSDIYRMFIKPRIIYILGYFRGSLGT